jgi:hypothetical protein
MLNKRPEGTKKGVQNFVGNFMHSNTRRPRTGEQDNMKMDVKETRFYNVDWIMVAQGLCVS